MSKKKKKNKQIKSCPRCGYPEADRRVPGLYFPTNLEEETFRHLTEHFKRNRK